MATIEQTRHTVSSMVPQAGGTYEAADGGRNQIRVSQWPEQDYGGLEVNQGQDVGKEVHYPSGIEVDQNSQGIERDPSAPKVPSHSNEGKIVDTGQGRVDGGSQDHAQSRRVCGLPRRRFWALAAALALLIIGAAVGGGVGGSLAHRSHGHISSNPSNTTKSSPILQNSSISAVQWKDGSMNNQYRVYVQLKEGQILEAAWASNNPRWNTSTITDEGADIAPGTPITSSVGYPHVNTTFALVKNVYVVGRTGTLYERQSPYKEQEGVWGNDNFSGLYTTSNGSSVLSFWYQSFETQDQILAILFQELGENSLSISKYTSNSTNDNPWVSKKQSLAIQAGSPLAAAPIGSRRDLRLYLGDPSGTMKQYRYNLTSDSLSDPTSTVFELQPRAPLCVSSQDNRNYFTTTTLPQCATEDDQQLTHLIMFPSPDRSSLSLVSWNCSSGFIDQKPKIEPLLQANRTYLGLANTLTSLDSEDQRVYVLFDGGNGPEIEEWQVPPGAQNADWKVLGRVPATLT
ncbi:hypothetical protein HD806DRAFT_485891 [Xylariaceae sp. AK1471]|nr:hypothetical protein HD806DRAFT_485891 [Xylariaceae sp. AK1471]